MVRRRASLLEDALEGDAELSLSAVLDYLGCDDWLLDVFMVSIGHRWGSQSLSFLFIFFFLFLLLFLIIFHIVNLFIMIFFYVL
jgi:hypothetical protein